MLIRHAESEHNEAERNWDLRGLLLKRDHGITERGYAQCDALQAYVAAQRADAASPWADAGLELYASPLTRAIQTALIATDGIDKPLVLLPDARETDASPLWGRDSLGRVACALPDNLERELRRHAASAADEAAGAARITMARESDERMEAATRLQQEENALYRERIAATGAVTDSDVTDDPAGAQRRILAQSKSRTATRV